MSERPLHWADRGAIAQLGERLDRTQEVAGSSPASSIHKGPAQGVIFSDRADRAGRLIYLRVTKLSREL
jgi:hypothetical protein